MSSITPPNKGLELFLNHSNTTCALKDKLLNSLSFQSHPLKNLAFEDTLTIDKGMTSNFPGERGPSDRHSQMHLIPFTFSCLMLVVSVKAQYEKLFTNGPAFVNFPYPTIPVNCSEIGPSGSPLPVDHMEEGAGLFPALQWPSPAQNIREYLIVAEDPDAPLPHSVIHGLYYGIPRVFTGLEHGDFRACSRHNDSYMLEGNFWYGQNRRNTVYLPPKSMPEDGPHRYFFELIALREPIDRRRLSDRATLKEIADAIYGNVVGWGAWVGIVNNNRVSIVRNGS